MGTEHTFYDYVEDGENLIRTWLAAQPPPVKAKFTNWLLHLEATPPGKWSRPYVDTLTDDCEGLFEVRVMVSRIQYRLLGCHDTGDRTPTLLHGFTKPGNKVPKAYCDTALERKETVRGDLRSHRAVHDYS